MELAPKLRLFQSPRDGLWHAGGLPFVFVESGHYRRPSFAEASEADLRRAIEEFYRSASVILPPVDAASEVRFAVWNGSDLTLTDSPHPPEEDRLGVDVTELPEDAGAPALGISDFAGKRWHSTRGNSRFTGSQRDLLRLVQQRWSDRQPGTNRSGLDEVVVVPLPLTGFRCDSVAVDDRVALHARFSRRQPGEDGFARVTGVGEVEPAKFAAAVLYAKHTLCENGGTRSTGASWEVVTLLTSHLESDTPPPMDPLTIARNILEKPGGTKMPTDGDLARALVDALLDTEARVPLHDPDADPPPPTPELPADPPTVTAETVRSGELENLRCETVLLDETVPLAAHWDGERVRVTALGPREPVLWASIDNKGDTILSPIDGPPPRAPRQLAEHLRGKAKSLDGDDALRLAESIYHHSLRATYAPE
ncbi:MAG: hypothetical protein AAF654_08505 [Myxococcota bacterium]